jgi:hypothetical protein
VSGPVTRLPVLALLAVAAMALVAGCAVSDGGYGYGSVDYYEPYGFGYGGWGPGYGVAPFRGDHRFVGFHGAHAFRGAPAGRPMPSLPAGRGGGGFHGGGGGFHGGGGGRR